MQAADNNFIMCMAIPGKIIKSDGRTVTVDYGSKQLTAAVIEGSYKIGDYAIVQGGIVIERVPKAQIKKWQDFINKDYVG